MSSASRGGRLFVWPGEGARGGGVVETYGNAVCVFLADALSLGLALLKVVLVLELGSHIGGWGDVRWVVCLLVCLWFQDRSRCAWSCYVSLVMQMQDELS